MTVEFHRIAASGCFESILAMYGLAHVVLQIAACNSSVTWFDIVRVNYVRFNYSHVLLCVGTNGLCINEGHLLNRWICLEEIIGMTYWNSTSFFVKSLYYRLCMSPTRKLCQSNGNKFPSEIQSTKTWGKLLISPSEAHVGNNRWKTECRTKNSAAGINNAHSVPFTVCNVSLPMCLLGWIEWKWCSWVSLKRERINWKTAASTTTTSATGCKTFKCVG